MCFIRVDVPVANFDFSSDLDIWIIYKPGISTKNHIKVKHYLDLKGEGTQMGKFIVFANINSVNRKF